MFSAKKRGKGQPLPRAPLLMFLQAGRGRGQGAIVPRDSLGHLCTSALHTELDPVGSLPFLPGILPGEIDVLWGGWLFLCRRGLWPDSVVSWASGLGPQRGCPNLLQTDPQPVAQKPRSWGLTSSGLQRERHRKETLSDFKTHKT